MRNQIREDLPFSDVTYNIKLKDLSLENSELKAKIEDLESRLLIIKENQKNERIKHKNEIENLTENNRISQEEMIKKINELQTKLDQNFNNVKDDQQLNFQVNAFLDFLSSKEDQNIMNLNQAMKLYSNLFSSIKDHSEKNKTYEKQNSLLSAQLKKLEEKLENSNNKIHSLQKKIRYFKQNASNADKNITELTKNLQNKSKNEVSELENTINEQNIKIQELTIELKKAREQTNEQNKSYIQETYESKLTIQNNKIEILNKSIEEKEQQIQELQNKLQQTEENNQILSNLNKEKEKLMIDQEKIIEISKNKIKDYKIKESQLKNEYNELNTKIIEYETNIHELKYQISELKTSKDQKKDIKDEGKIIQTSDKYKEENEMLKESITSLEKLIESQTNEISELYKQRYGIVQQLNNVDSFLLQNDSSIQKVLKKYNLLLKDNKNLKKKIIQTKVRTKNLINSSINQILDLIPQELSNEVNNLKNQSIDKVINNLTKTLLQHFEELESNKNIQNENKELNYFKKRYNAILMQLDGAYRCLKSIAYGRDQDLDSNLRSELLKSCARIGSFIDVQKEEFPLPEFRKSIFNTFDIRDPENISQILLDFIPEDDIYKTPYHELITLILCMVQVNILLNNRILSNEQKLFEFSKISQLEEDHMNQIRELENWKLEQITNNQRLSKVISKILNEQTNDFKILSDRFIDIFSDEPISIIKESEKNIMIENIDDLENQVKMLQKRLMKKENEKKKTEKEISNKDIIEKTIKQNQEINEYKIKFEESQNQLTEMESKILHQKETSQSTINDLTSQNSLLQEENHKLHEYLKEKESSIMELNNNKESLQERIKEINQKMQKVISQKNNYKQKYNEISQNNSITLADLKERSIDLNSKYEERINELETELETVKESLTKANENINKFNKIKNDLQLQNAKLQLSERTALLKVKSLTDALTREKEESKAKQLSIMIDMKNQNNKVINNLNDTIEDCKMLLIKVLNEEFNYKIDENKEIDLNNLLSIIYSQLKERKEQQNISKDVIILKKRLCLSPTKSLISAYDTISQKLNDQNEFISKLNEQIKTNQSKISQLEKENKTLQRYKKELSDWNNWSNSMLHQISDTSFLLLPSADTRFLLEESILSSISHRSLVRKMNILRAEKKLYKSSKLQLLSPKREKVRSVRPLILAFIFSSRLMKTSGKIPINYSSPQNIT